MHFVVIGVSLCLTLQLSAACTSNCWCPPGENVDCSYLSIVDVPELHVRAKTLNASHSNVTILPRNTFYKLVKLGEEIVTSSANSTGIIKQYAFKGQTHLKIIDLSWNSISYVHPEVFMFTQKLMWLSLAHNNALKLPENGSFYVVKTLKVLDFSYCNISNIGERMFKTGKHALEELYFQHNIISSIHQNAFTSFISLRVLDLSHNRLSTIQVGMVAPLSQINSLVLQNNPWACNSSFEDVYSWSILEGVNLGNVNCGPTKGVEQFGGTSNRTRRHVADKTSDSGSEESKSNSSLVLIIIGILVAVVAIIILCVCLFNSGDNCVETAGCLFICQQCYQ